MFMAADETFVLDLARDGFTRDEGTLYAVGRIVIMVPDGSPLTADAALDDLEAGLADGRVTRFAIANPDHARPDWDHHDSDHHTPHPASDHTLNLTAQTQSPSVAITFFCLLADTSVVFEVTQHQPPIPVLERIKPSGESPPGPLQPRAPPLT
jgi:hypothetical protein